MNDLSEGFTTHFKLFEDNVSLFSVVNNINLPTSNLDSDLSKLNVWPNQ